MKNKKMKIFCLLWAPVFLAVFLVFSAVGCQGNKTPAPAATKTEAASPESTDTSEATPEATATIEEETPTPISGDFKRKTDRDPFIPPIKAPPKDQPKPAATITPTEAPTDIVDATPTKTGPVEIPASSVGVEVTGIMKVGGGYQAILTGSGGKSYLVTVGQKLGDYRVAQITKDMVVLKTANYVARLRIKEDVKTTGGKTTPGTPDDTGPKAPAPPAQP